MARTEVTRPGRFDLVYYQYALHFLPEPPASLRASWDVVDPGGSLLVLDEEHGLAAARRRRIGNDRGLDRAVRAREEDLEPRPGSVSPRDSFARLGMSTRD